MLEELGGEFETVCYLDKVPAREELERLYGLLGLTMVRTQEPLYQELQLAGADGDRLVEALMKHPILIERPIVIIGERAVVARPAELALKLLEPD